MNGQRIKKVCNNCAIQFEDYISNKRSGFCSLKCYWEARKNNPKYSGYWLGKKRSQDTIQKISLNRRGKMTGKKHFAWKGGISSENSKIRNSSDYKLWRKTVFKRDYWTCVLCGYKGQKLEADHIRSFALFPELRFDVFNGRTLCYWCHKKITFKKV